MFYLLIKMLDLALYFTCVDQNEYLRKYQCVWEVPCASNIYLSTM